MKSLTISSLTIATAFVLSLAPPLTDAQGGEDDSKYYSKRYDSIDVGTIFRSSRLLNNYVDCLLDKKPCPPEGKDLKRVLPHALRTRCARCTKIQKAKALDVITRLYYEHPSVYIALAERYDPNGDYTKNFENWFDEQNGIKPRPPIPDISNTIPGKQEGQTFNRRSPNLDDSTSSSSVNNFDYSHRTRIPTTWVTTSTTTTLKPTTTRAPLRTTTASFIRTTKMSSDRVNNPTSTVRAPYQPPNFFIPLFPRPDHHPISQSINKLLDTTEKVVSSFTGMVRTILAG